jgi:lauroyl/myristoyl acyltransferase
MGDDQVPRGAVNRYFRNFGALAALQARVFHRGFDAAHLHGFLGFGDSLQNLDEAVRQGRGVILVAPHLFGHELGAGLINLRHRVVALVRESSNSRRQLIKDRWYQALGLETVRRRRRTTAASDLQACLHVLRQGAILGITPDLIVDAAEGVSITMFGRTVYVKPGFAALAARACVSNVGGKSARIGGVACGARS